MTNVLVRFKGGIPFFFCGVILLLVLLFASGDKEYLLNEKDLSNMIWYFSPSAWGILPFFWYGAAAYLLPILLVLIAFLYPLYLSFFTKFFLFFGSFFLFFSSTIFTYFFDISITFPFVSGGSVGRWGYQILKYFFPMNTLLFLYAIFFFGIIMVTQRYLWYLLLWLLRGPFGIKVRSIEKIIRGVTKDWFFYFFPIFARAFHKKKAEEVRIHHIIESSLQQDLYAIGENTGLLLDVAEVPEKKINDTVEDQLYVAPAIDKDRPINFLHEDNLANDCFKPSTRDEENEEIAEKIVEIGKKFGIHLFKKNTFVGPSVNSVIMGIECPNRVSSLLSHEGDFAYFLGHPGLRIVYPFSGDTLGICFEYPRKNRSVVYFNEYVSDSGFSQNYRLGCFLGVDTKGIPHFLDLATAPHLLIAGTTGSGKSSLLHALVMSFLWRYSPQEVQCFFFDPKRVEFFSYQSLPHTKIYARSPEEIAVTLESAVEIMDDRYRLFEGKKVRQWSDFCKKFPEEAATLPLIVLFIDEYAEIVSVNKDAERLVMRLSQMARAAGMHIVLATQRPSVDVITGVLKANFPIRIACKVASIHDSRVILGVSGAEKLLGRGDFLLSGNDGDLITRLQAPYVDYLVMEKIIGRVTQQGCLGLENNCQRDNAKNG